MKTITIYKNDLPHTYDVLRKMFKDVGAPISKVDISKENWFYSYSWSKEKQDKFIEWLTNYLYNSKSAREEIMNLPVKNKTICRSVSTFFVFNYGWKTKSESIQQLLK